MGVGGSFAWLPGRAAGEGLLRFEAGAAYLPSQTVTIASTPSRGGTFGLLAANLRTCVFVLRRPFELAPCVGGEIASLHAEGSATKAVIANTLYFEALAGGTLGVRLTGAWVLRLDLGGAVPFDRPTFVVQGAAAGPVHRPGALAGRAAIGIELRF